MAQMRPACDPDEERRPASDVAADTRQVDELSALVAAFRSCAARKQHTEIVRIGLRILALNARNLDTAATVFESQFSFGRFDDAAETLAGISRFYAKSHVVMVMRARLASARHDFPESARLWLEVQRAFPRIHEAYRAGAQCLASLGDAEGAVELYRRGVSANPGEISFWIAGIDYLIKVHRPEEARQLWESQRGLHAADWRSALAGAKVAIALNDRALAAHLLDSCTSLDTIGSAEERDKLAAEMRRFELRDMLLCCESLGGRLEGCEFGLLQRAFKAEPLGLLRWANMSPANLIAALERRFDGVGEPENTLLRPPEKPGDDWMTADRNFGMETHTFRRDAVNEENAARLYTEACRRLKFLKGKLLEDIQAAEKLFVFKVTYDFLDEVMLARLHGALSAIGDATLLYVRPADDTHPAGLVEPAGPRLLVGYIERFSYSLGRRGVRTGDATEAWIQVMEPAFRIWKADTRQARNAP